VYHPGWSSDECEGGDTAMHVSIHGLKRESEFVCSCSESDSAAVADNSMIQHLTLTLD